MAGGSDAQARPRRWLRRIAAGLALVLLAALAVRIVLTVYAAEIFVFALGRALAGSGAEVVFAEPPVVTFEGFQSKGVVLRSVGGEQWLEAAEASGSAHLLLREPYVSVALTLRGARVAWKEPASRNDDDAHAAALANLSLPPSLSSIELVDGVVDPGDGRTIRLDATIAAAAGGSTRVKIGRLDYAEPSGERAGEKLAGQITLTPSAGGEAKLDLRIERGAVLAGAVLLDFAAHPLDLAAKLQHGDDSLAFREASLALGKLLAATGSVKLAGGKLDTADVRIVSADLEPAYATFVREPFAGVAPALAGSELRGKGDLSVQISAPSRHRANATITLSLDSLRTRSVEAHGVAVDLPWIGAAEKSAAARSGRVRAKSVSLLGFSWSGLDVPVDAAAGRLRTKSVQDWKTAGGALRVTGLAFDDDEARGPRLSGDVELVSFDLGVLGEALGRKGLSGTIGGRLGRVEIDGEAVRAAGSVDVRAWGGTVSLSRLSVEDPFGRIPELGLDVAARDIDLEALTAAFGFGRVSGVLEGRVTGLVIADGQPQAFEADLHTVERHGVSQTIDVRAIAQLGALGGDTGSLTGSLLKVIDRYRYSAMGVRCRLRNDVFEIRGVETKGGRDYLVKGSLLPPSVSVVSHSQVISFSEMLRRVERITEIGEGGAPDVHQ